MTGASAGAEIRDKDGAGVGAQKFNNFGSVTWSKGIRYFYLEKERRKKIL